MTIPIEFVRSLPIRELRRLVTIKENLEEIDQLMAERDGLFERARQIQSQIDDLLELGSDLPRKKRLGPPVKELCMDALRGTAEGLTAAEVKAAILESHPHRNNRTFYNQVFIALTRSPEFRKQRSGKFVVGTASGRRKRKG